MLVQKGGPFEYSVAIWNLIRQHWKLQAQIGGSNSADVGSLRADASIGGRTSD